MPVMQESRNSFFNAIDTAPDHRIRAVLRAVCALDEKVMKRCQTFYRDIAAKEEKADSDSDRISIVNLTTANAGNSRKRKAEGKLSICVRCLDSFDEEDNHKYACRYHPGEREPDFEGDSWVDHDEDCHGTIDTEEMFDNYPDGFIWRCCDRLGDSAGCTKGFHSARDGERGLHSALTGRDSDPEEAQFENKAQAFGEEEGKDEEEKDDDEQ